ncbi:MAG: hypothetical protein HC897_00255 [Thermoanaerobaculia bacterium]|nr:hypothetical protein [Thermoanaerobaculia bacterium]
MTSNQIIDGTKTFIRQIRADGGIASDDLQVGSSTTPARLEVHTSFSGLDLNRVGGLKFGELLTNTSNDFILRAPSGRLRTQGDLYLRYSDTASWNGLYAGDLNVYSEIELRDSNDQRIGTFGRSANNVYYNDGVGGDLEVRTRLKVTGNNDEYLSFGPIGSDYIRFVEGSLASADLDVHLGSGNNGWLRIHGNERVRGSVAIEGNLSKFSGSFRIDHPLDPENKYLYHSFVESPDMMNVYNGNVTTNASGEAWVDLPDYFEALNVEFRYQLTCLGTFAQAIVGREIGDNRFLIQTDQPYVKVSWQVTGIRNDSWARENRIVAEVEKPLDERGRLLFEPADAKATLVEP